MATSSMLQNGTMKNNDTTLALEKIIFDKASFQNYGLAAFAHSYGVLSNFNLYKNSQLCVQEAEFTVQSLQHEGLFSFVSGLVCLDTESQLQVSLLVLESNKAMLKSIKAMTFIVPTEGDFSWTHMGTL